MRWRGAVAVGTGLLLLERRGEELEWLLRCFALVLHAAIRREEVRDVHRPGCRRSGGVDIHLFVGYSLSCGGWGVILMISCCNPCLCSCLRFRQCAHSVFPGVGGGFANETFDCLSQEAQYTRCVGGFECQGFVVDSRSWRWLPWLGRRRGRLRVRYFLG